MHDQINCNKRVLPALFHLRCPSQSHLPTFRPCTHTSDDSYIYQLSLVVATATVSFAFPSTFLDVSSARELWQPEVTHFVRQHHHRFHCCVLQSLLLFRVCIYCMQCASTSWYPPLPFTFQLPLSALFPEYLVRGSERKQSYGYPKDHVRSSHRSFV